MEQIKNGHASPLILSAKDVEVKFNLRGKTLTAVRGASLDLYEGETLAIVGESGSGKSTCMNIIGCLDVPTEGTYRLDGRDVGRMLQLLLAYVLEHPAENQKARLLTLAPQLWQRESKNNS